MLYVLLVSSRLPLAPVLVAEKHQLLLSSADSCTEPVALQLQVWLCGGFLWYHRPLAGPIWHCHVGWQREVPLEHKYGS